VAQSPGEPLLYVVSDERFALHAPRGYHPERPERLDAAQQGLTIALARDGRPQIAAPLAASPASAALLARVHAPAHLNALSSRLAAGPGQIDADTYVAAASAEAVWLAAGSAASLARTLLSRRGGRGIALVRPPGHHATPERSMGFCLLNNVAVGAAEALARGARRVAIVDWDVHHGNGTQRVFEADPRVLFVSLHQDDLFPVASGHAAEVGVGPGAGFTVNVALPAGSGPEAYGEAFRRVVLPLLARFDADLTLVSAGYDAHARDPLGGMALDAPTFGAMTSALVTQAEQAGHGRVGFVLEGGYDLVALESSVTATVSAALGHGIALPEGRVSAPVRAAVDATVEALRPHWPGTFL
jgi:acetoin utilization deacetylase AcuC-like enzyme